MGFETPRTAKDHYTLDLWRKHGLGDHPSFKEIEPVATRLLVDDPLAAAAMVLCRRVDAKEKKIVSIFILTPKKSFVLLLLHYELENPTNAD
ncbi:hypothetical protein KW791_02945 [Candidatus Parcubacteria bacterium]|nr:hypothetical protein [Candidatus Parcubacteria bacterium]